MLTQGGSAVDAVSPWIVDVVVEVDRFPYPRSLPVLCASAPSLPTIPVLVEADSDCEYIRVPRRVESTRFTCIDCRVRSVEKEGKVSYNMVLLAHGLSFCETIADNHQDRLP